MARQSEDYSESTVDELMDMARERGITGISSMRKQDLIEALESGDGNGGGDRRTSARGDSRDSDARSNEDGSDKNDGAMSDRDERRRAS